VGVGGRKGRTGTGHQDRGQLSW